MISYEELSQVFDMDNPLTLEYFELCSKSTIERGERHHILPRSIWPEYIKSKWNLVNLSFENHYKAHEFLVQIIIEEKHRLAMLRAWYLMSSRTNGEFVSDHKIYAELRSELIKKQSEEVSGEKHPQFGTHRKQSTKDKLSIACLGRKDSPETVEKKRTSGIGRKHTIESRAKMSIAMRGLQKSDEHKAKLSAVNLGKKNGPCSEQTKTNIRLANRYVFQQYLPTGELIKTWDSSLDFEGTDFDINSIRGVSDKFCADGNTSRKYRGFVWKKILKKSLNPA